MLAALKVDKKRETLVNGSCGTQNSPELVPILFYNHNIYSLISSYIGIGVGLIVPLTHVVLNQHFSQYRALALGVAYSGSSAGSFLFPPLAHLLLGQYGLAGTFLLLGGVMLNALVGAMLFRAPPEKSQEKSSPKCPPDERPVRISVVTTRMESGVVKKSWPVIDGGECLNLLTLLNLVKDC